MSALLGDPHFSPRMVVFITNTEEKSILERAFDSLHIPICYQCRGKGTAPSEMLDIFGLSGAVRLITIGIMPKPLVSRLTSSLQEEILFHKRGGGIMLSLPITGMQNPVFQMLSEEAKDALKGRIEERIRKEMEEIKEQLKYVVIWVSVDAGYSDEVIDAASEAGAKGGTVRKGRQRNSERVQDHLGLSLQEERDFVLMVVPKEKKADIMTAIGKACGLCSQSHGILLSLPVDEVMGLEEQSGK